MSHGQTMSPRQDSKRVGARAPSAAGHSRPVPAADGSGAPPASDDLVPRAADPSTTQAESSEIPVIDLDEPDPVRLAAQLHHACSTWGFFQLINHGIAPDLVAAFRTAMARFFALPFAAKVALKRDVRNARGYFDDELTKRRRDWKEALDVGVPGGGTWDGRPDDDAGNACLDGLNRFPLAEACPGFRAAVVRYFDACATLSHRLAALMLRALGGGDGDGAELLERMQEDHSSYLRLNYYPPSDGRGAGAADLHRNSFSGGDAAPRGALGISPHRDAGFLTVLLQDDDCHSLQVARFEDDDHGRDAGRWVTVRPVKGALTINTGDMAMICSNGRFRAPLHRVLTDPTRPRYSAPFFYNPGYNELIAPLACCCGPGNGDNCAQEHVLEDSCNNDQSNYIQQGRSSLKKYHPCLWGYFRALRFAGDLTDLGVEIQTSHFKIGTESSHIKRQQSFMEVVNFDEPFDVEKYRHILESIE